MPLTRATVHGPPTRALRRLTGIAACAAISAGVPTPAAADVAGGTAVQPAAPSSSQTVDTRPAAAAAVQGYVVSVRRRSDVTDVERHARWAGARDVRRYSAVLDGFAVRLDDAAAARLDRRPGVTVVPDVLLRGSAVQADASWGLDRIDQRVLPLDRSYAYGRTGLGVKAYVVDSGVRADHAELAGRVARGFDAVQGRSSADCNGHGSHVAGTVGGRTAGVAKRVSVVPVRVLDCDGAGRLSDVLEGLDFVARDHAPGQAAVANLSLGGARNEVLDAAVGALVRDGVTVVAAAGNAGTSACRESPAAVPAVITVAATGPTDRAPDWTNDGSCVDLFAPGVGIRSAWHTGVTATRELSGTSMAAPHVAGAAALVLEGEPGASPSRVWDVLRTAVTAGAVTGAATGTPNRLLSVLDTPAKSPRGLDQLRRSVAEPG